jgi:hypothetical protein
MKKSERFDAAAEIRAQNEREFRVMLGTKELSAEDVALGWHCIDEDLIRTGNARLVDNLIIYLFPSAGKALHRRIMTEQIALEDARERCVAEWQRRERFGDESEDDDDILNTPLPSQIVRARRMQDSVLLDLSQVTLNGVTTPLPRIQEATAQEEWDDSQSSRKYAASEGREPRRVRATQQR